MKNETATHDGYDILRRIAETRAKRVAREGHELGADVPARRVVPVEGVALGHSGRGTHGLLICEIKRRSPSRGEIAGVGDPATTAREYARLGATAISVLTETDNFGGSLDDLMAVKAAVGGPAVLRKDFLLDEEDIEVSYRAGADMVLLIATLLDRERLASLYARATQLGMTPLVELYTAEDAEKAGEIAPRLTGINSRDLTTFQLDRLNPPAVSAHVTWPTDLIYESGIWSGEDARLAASAGFSGILVGESVVRNRALVGELASGLAAGAASSAGLAAGATSPGGGTPARARGRGDFAGAPVAGRGDFWSRVARSRGQGAAAAEGGASAVASAAAAAAEGGTSAEGAGAAAPAGSTKSPARPLVKICGITNRVDAQRATELGADLLGFVFADSPRAASEELLESVADLDVVKVAVVVAGGDRGGVPQAVRRALSRGLIHAVQLHGEETPDECAELAFPYYKALRLRGPDEVAAIGDYRCPRVLVDAFDRHAHGGTGRRIRADLVDAAAKAGPLWMAGGIGADNVGEVILRHRPELIDASSLLEAQAGRKDHEKLERFFEEIRHATRV
ncbi:MAG: bifunctional indole-3-glycerol phosphate synthase/phosphoribosylanthranilate isomerase [Spirochaetota bacterium]